MKVPKVSVQDAKDVTPRDVSLRQFENQVMSFYHTTLRLLRPLYPSKFYQMDQIVSLVKKQ